MSRTKKQLPTDTELLDWLEEWVKGEPLVLWNGGERSPATGIPGLSLLSGQRSLRQALANLVPKK